MRALLKFVNLWGGGWRKGETFWGVMGRTTWFRTSSTGNIEHDTFNMVWWVRGEYRSMRSCLPMDILTEASPINLLNYIWVVRGQTVLNCAWSSTKQNSFNAKLFHWTYGTKYRKYIIYAISKCYEFLFSKNKFCS